MAGPLAPAEGTCPAGLHSGGRSRGCESAREPFIRAPDRQKKPMRRVGRCQGLAHVSFGTNSVRANRNCGLQGRGVALGVLGYRAVRPEGDIHRRPVLVTNLEGCHMKLGPLVAGLAPSMLLTAALAASTAVASPVLPGPRTAAPLVMSNAAAGTWQEFGRLQVRRGLRSGS